MAALTGKDNYEFGDVSRKFSGIVSNWTSSNLQQDQDNVDENSTYTYRVGDVTKWLLREIRNTPSSASSYQFGDLTKSWVSNYTGEEEYKVGDLSRAVLRRVESGEYSVGDVFLAMRVLLWAGFTTFAPVVGNLPLTLVVNLINFGLAQEVSGRLTTALAEWLDQQLKKALTGNAKYVLGDITRERLEQGLAKFTGREQYEIGDITRTIQRIQSNSVNKNSTPQTLSLSTEVLSALDQVRQKSKMPK